MNRIVKNEDGSKYVLKPEEAKLDADQLRKQRELAMGLLEFELSDEEDDSLETVEVDKDVKSDFLKSAEAAAGGVVDTTPVIGQEDWKTQGGTPHNKTGFATQICDILSPKGIKNVAHNLGLREKTPSNSDEDSSGNSSLSNNPFYAIREEDEEEEEQPDSSETTHVLAVAQIEEQQQVGASIVRAHSNESTGDLHDLDQGEPIIEGGQQPQVEQPQPHEVADSKAEDFHQAGSD